MRIMKVGATSQSVYFDILDSTSTTGGRKTGLAYNTASLIAYYTINGAAAVAITLVTQTASGAYSSGGFVEVDATHAPGIYRLDLPNAAIASGASVVITLTGATGMVTASIEIQLVAVDLQDAVRAGLTALPNANAEAAGGLFTRGTGAGQINQDANGRVDVSLKAILGTTLTETVGGYLAAAYKKLFDVATPVLTAASVNQTGDNYARLGAPAGASVSADVAALKTDVDGGVVLTSAYDFAKGTVAMTESYAALHSAPTPVQALFAIVQKLFERSVSGTTETINKVDGLTAAMTETLDSSTSPTSITRAT